MDQSWEPTGLPSTKSLQTFPLLGCLSTAAPIQEVSLAFLALCYQDQNHFCIQTSPWMPQAGNKLNLHSCFVRLAETFITPRQKRWFSRYPNSCHVEGILLANVSFFFFFFLPKQSLCFSERIYVYSSWSLSPSTSGNREGSFFFSPKIILKRSSISVPELFPEMSPPALATPSFQLPLWAKGLPKGVSVTESAGSFHEFSPAQADPVWGQSVTHSLSPLERENTFPLNLFPSYVEGW